MIIKNRDGFTFVELIASLTILGIILTYLVPAIINVSNNVKNLENRNILVDGISSIDLQLRNYINSSYGIDYDNTYTDGNIDKITLYMDKIESSKLELFIERDVSKDFSKIYAKYNDTEKIALHNSLIYIEEFQIETSSNPRLDYELVDVQPNVSFTLKARNINPNRTEYRDEYKEFHKISELEYYTGIIIIRNYFPSSLRI